MNPELAALAILCTAAVTVVCILALLSIMHPPKPAKFSRHARILFNWLDAHPRTNVALLLGVMLAGFWLGAP